jgi:hypothetical protein
MQAEPEPTQEFVVRIGLMAFPSVSDDLLEELTIRLERALEVDAADIAPGASASTNFLTRAIELDFTIVSSPIEIHGLVGEVTRIALGSIDPEAVTFGSSTTASAPAYA